LSDPAEFIGFSCRRFYNEETDHRNNRVRSTCPGGDFRPGDQDQLPAELENFRDHAPYYVAMEKGWFKEEGWT
jgi:hypothetical protein